MSQVSVVKDYPPNYEQICAAFPEVRNIKTVIFTYGNNIYNPGGWPIDEALMLHERVHVSQQLEMGVEEWWQEYLDNPQFRTNQEIEAYQVQFRHLKSYSARPVWRRELDRLARDLSSPIYGNILSFDEAKKVIKGDS